MFYTTAYKNAWIHIKCLHGIEEITVQDMNNKLYKVKSIRAGKILITKLLKNQKVKKVG